MAKLNKVKSIGDLRYLCYNGDQQERYQKLATISSHNLGGKSEDTIDGHLHWLEINAMESGSEEGVVDEINFCLDMA